MRDLLYPQLRQYTEQAAGEYERIPKERKDVLDQLASYILGKRRLGEPARIVVICTHNSRRSHFGKTWLQIGAIWYGIHNFESYSGGTEITAFHPNAVDALRQSGVELLRAENGNNPVYLMRFGPDLPGIAMFSKHYEDAPNPLDGFCAFLVCSQADKACPVVVGAEARIALPYEDPGPADGSENAGAKYDEINRQFAREMLYVLSRVKANG